MRRIKIAGGVLVLVALALLSKYSSTEIVAIRHFLQAVHAAGNWGLAFYALSVALSVAFMLPGFFLCVGGGFLFGALKGLALFVCGETLGSVLAFAVARRYFRSRALGFFRKHPKLGFLNESLAAEGWRFIALTRMTPLFPFKLSNYFFGAVGFSFRDFFWGTLLGTLPLSFTLVYLGSLIPDLAALENRTLWRSPRAETFTIFIGALSVAGMILIARRATRHYRQKLRAWEQSRNPKSDAVIP